MSTTASNAAVRSTEDKPKRKAGGAVAALAALGLGAHALRKGVIKKHGKYVPTAGRGGKRVAGPGMWGKAAKQAVDTVEGGVRNVKARVHKRFAKRGELSALAEVCARELAEIAPEREMQAPGLVANERGEMPWQEHQRKKKNERLVKTGAAAALTGAVGYGAHRVAQAAGGYKKLHGDFKFRNKMHGTGYAMKRAGQDLKPAAQQVAGKAVSAVKGAGRGAMEALKRLRGR